MFFLFSLKRIVIVFSILTLMMPLAQADALPTDSVDSKYIHILFSTLTRGLEKDGVNWWSSDDTPELSLKITATQGSDESLIGKYPLDISDLKVLKGKAIKGPYMRLSIETLQKIAFTDKGLAYDSSENLLLRFTMEEVHVNSLLSSIKKTDDRYRENSIEVLINSAGNKVLRNSSPYELELPSFTDETDDEEVSKKLFINSQTRDDIGRRRPTLAEALREEKSISPSTLYIQGPQLRGQIFFTPLHN